MKLPKLILGTAMWGWTIPKETCFNILEEFYKNGYRAVDTATNYPINKNPKDFRKAENILQDWIQTHGVSDLKIMMKVGSLNNLRTPEHNLVKSFLLMILDDYHYKFRNNLETIMVHWDNREAEKDISNTFEAMDIMAKNGLKLGLSGIKYPEIYYRLNQSYLFDFVIQMKHNLLFSDYDRYEQFKGKRRFITYGINAGGLKLNLKKYHSVSSLKVRGGDTEQLHPVSEKVSRLINEFNSNQKTVMLNSFNQIGMIYTFYSPDILGILIGPSSVEQLKNTIDFYHIIDKIELQEFYQKLKTIN